jgi:hypothetical protein
VEFLERRSDTSKQVYFIHCVPFGLSRDESEDVMATEMKTKGQKRKYERKKREYEKINFI